MTNANSPEPASEEHPTKSMAMICASLTVGKSLSSICKLTDKLNIDRIFRWLTENECFRREYEHAKLIRRLEIAREFGPFPEYSSKDEVSAAEEDASFKLAELSATWLRARMPAAIDMETPGPQFTTIQLVAEPFPPDFPKEFPDEDPRANPPS